VPAEMSGLIVFLFVLAAMALIVWLAARDTRQARRRRSVERSDEPDEEKESGKTGDR
jgi:hypothetical protein